MMIIAVAAMSFSSCEKDPQAIDNGIAKKTISVIPVTDDTKTTLNSDHSKFTWTAGDNFRLFTDANGYDPQTLAYSSPSAAITAEVSEAANKVYAYYFAGTYTYNDPTSYTAYINQNQTQSEAGVFNGQNLPMAGSGIIDGSAVKLLFKPMASVLVLNIYSTAAKDGETIQSVKITPTANTKFCGSRTTNITAETVKYDQATSSSDYQYINVTLDTPSAYAAGKPSDSKTYNGQIYAVIAKQSYKSVNFEITTNLGVYTITSSATTAIDCTSSDFVPVNINLAKATFNPKGGLADGDYVIVANWNKQYVAMSSKAEGKRLDYVQLSGFTTDATLYGTSDAEIIWTLENSGEGFRLKNGSNFLYWSSDNSASTSSTNSVLLTAAKNEAQNTYQISVLNNTEPRILAKNSATAGTLYGFAFYKDSQIKDLYVVPAKLIAAPSIDVNTSNINLDYDDTATKDLDVSISGDTSHSIGAYADINGTVDSDWLDVIEESGQFAYAASSANPDHSQREAYIIISATNDDGTTTKTIKVIQAEKPANGVKVSSENVVLGASSGAALTINITCNWAWKAELSDESTGFSITPESGTGDGTITITSTVELGASGQIIITDQDDKVSSATINVSQREGADEYEWVLVSSLEDLTEGTYVLASVKTAGTWAYMPNTESSGSNPTLGTLSSAPSNNKLDDSNIADNMKWSLVSTGTANQFYIRPSGNSTMGLGTTNSTGANIRISSSYVNTKWTFSTSQSYNWQIKNDNKTVMYLAVYADTAWRNYSSATTNQNGKFYLFKQVVK